MGKDGEGQPLQTLFRILIISAVILVVGFYMNLNDRSSKDVLIKENSGAHYKEPEALRSPDKTATNKREQPNEGLSTLIGKNVNELVKQWGQPSRIDQTIYGYEWYIYKKDNAHYFQAGVEDKKLVTIFAVGKDLNASPFELGESVEEIFNTQFFDANISIKLEGNIYRFELNDTDLNTRPLLQLGDIFAQLYIDKFTGTLSSVRFLDAATLVKQRPYELVYRGQLLDPIQPDQDKWQSIEEGTEKEIFDLTNVLRSRYDLKALEWDEKLSEAAYAHSEDMAENNDFAHTSKKFGTLSDRLKKAEVTFQSAGENIAAKYTDGPAVVEGWLNSKGHRDSLLNKDFTHLGVGVYKKYYTQNYIKKFEQ